MKDRRRGRSLSVFVFVGLAGLALAAAGLAACGGGGNEKAKPNTPEAGTPSALAQCQRTGEKQFAAAPPMIIDQQKTYTATIQTEKGNIVLELFAKDTPITTNNFVFLACHGFYDGLTFHRVIPGFVAQGGDPTGTGAGGPGYTIPDEPDVASFDAPGMLSMAKAGANTTGSQFFITYAPVTRLDANFTVFGRVTEGMDVLERLTPRDPAQTPGAPPGDKILRVDIEEK
jgi:cyclophilin family peptidyl-prolyl cis-trans isomerase